MDIVVTVDEGDEVASCEVETGVASAGETAVFLVNNFNAGVLLCENVAKLAAHIGRAVVDEDDFEVLVGLGEDGVNATLEEFGDIIDRDDNGDERLRICCVRGRGGGLGICG